MIKIANIFTEQELSNHEKKDWINYVLYEPFMKENLMLYGNFALPTLIIGWNFLKRQAPFLTNFQPNILQKKIPNSNIIWEFSKDEKMTDHFNGVSEFVKTAPRKFIEIRPYRNVDPIKDNIIDEDHLIHYIGGFLSLYHCNVYQYKDEIIYLYDRTRFQITGIYLNSYKYFGYDIEKIKLMIFDRVRQNEKNKATMDIDGTIYQSFYKQFPEFDQLKRSIVLFLS